MEGSKRVRRQQLADHRRERGFSQESLATEIGVSWNTVARWERGESEPLADSRAPLARALGISLARLDRVLRNKDDEIADNEGIEELRRLVPDWLSIYVSMEQSAGRVEAFEPHVIHGLLQLREYAEALIKVSDYARQNGDRAQHLVDMRTARRAALLRETNPLEFTLILSETALRTVVGGPETMRAQLDHIATMAERPNVTLHVLPFSSGPHSASYGPFSFLAFPWDLDARTVYLESYVGDANYVRSQYQVDHFTSLYNRLQALALTPRESVKMVQQVAEEYTP